MSDFNTQPIETQSVTQLAPVVQTLVNAAESKGYDYRIEELTSWNEEFKHDETKLYFRFRQDRKKNSMIWFEYVGHGLEPKMMFFNMRFNGCNGHIIKSWKQERKSRELLGVTFAELLG